MQTAQAQFRYDMIIFDVGGTLSGFRDHAPFQEFLAHAGLSASDEDARHLHDRLVSAIVAERDAAQGLGAEAAELDRWWRRIFSLAWPNRPDLAEEMFAWLLAGRLDRLFPDALPTLEMLRGLGMPMGILSNFGMHLYDILDRFDLLGYFEFVIVSAEVGLAKPDRRVFELLVDRAKRPRDRMLYVGDHLGDDIQGARDAGLDAVLIDRVNRQPETPCPRIVSLLDLEQYIRPPTHPALAVIFDMDGVLLDSPRMHLRTWQLTLAPLGIKLTAQDLYPLEGTPTERTAQQLTEWFLGQACSDQEAQRLAQTKRTLFREMFDPALLPGMLPLLHDLRGRGHRLGLVTGSARSVVDESLAPTGIVGLFDAIITGDQVWRGKPDPEPYRLAAEQLELPPSDCLVVENAPLGIQSAKAAGMDCVAIETTLSADQLAAAPVDRVFPDVQSLRAWLLSQ